MTTPIAAPSPSRAAQLAGATCPGSFFPARLAQQAEQSHCRRSVAGSTPAAGTISGGAANPPEPVEPGRLPSDAPGAPPRPFFSYYGSKWTGARHYGPPRRDLVIEPFAGSACYSTRWGCRNVRLYDVSPDICDLWDWLIGCSVADIAALPDAFESIDEVMCLARGPQLLVRHWISKGRAEPSCTLSPWYFRWRSATDCRVWGRSVKNRIIQQKPMLDKWRIEQKSWHLIPMEIAHWHIDPPYNNPAGRRYPFSNIDYSALAEWCRSLPGTVDVCENVGARWLNFEPLYSVVSCRGRRNGSVSREAVWRSAS